MILQETSMGCLQIKVITDDTCTRSEMHTIGMENLHKLKNNHIEL